MHGSDSLKKCSKWFIGGVLLGGCAVSIVANIPGCIQSRADILVVQTIESEDYSIVLRRIYYHATVSYVYDVEACSKVTKRCGVYFKGMKFGQSPPTIRLLNENRVVVNARSGHILDFSNRFDYDFEPLRGVVFILRTDDSPSESIQ